MIRLVISIKPHRHTVHIIVEQCYLLQSSKSSSNCRYHRLWNSKSRKHVVVVMVSGAVSCRFLRVRNPHTSTHTWGMQQSILLQSSKIWPKTTKCGTSIHFWNQWRKTKTQIPNSIFATSDWVAEPLIGPRGLSFKVLSVWVPRRALYHFATMVGLGSFLCPRRFFLSVHICQEHGFHI
jgi:hypothetical protein